MWQIDNLRRALQDAQDSEADTATPDAASSSGASDSASSNGATARDSSTSSSNGSSSGYPIGNGASESDNGASSSSENGSHASSFPKAAGPSSAGDQSRVPVSSNGAGPHPDGLQDGKQAEAERSGGVSTVTGRGSWQTQGLFRGENSDEEKGPGPTGNGYTPSSNGAALAQDRAPGALAGTARSSSATATATPAATVQPSSTPGAAESATPSPAADSSAENRLGSRPAAADTKRLSGLQQQKVSASHQLAWDSADQEFDDAATVMNVLRCELSPQATK